MKKEYKILKLFIQFLKEKNVYHSFLKALRYDETYRIMNSQAIDPSLFIVHNLTYSPQNIIANAFDWNRKPNQIAQIPCGGWCQIDELWRRRLSKYGFYDYFFSET